MFQKLDEDHTGTIDRQELQNALILSPRLKSNEERNEALENIIEQIDFNHDN